MQLGLLGMVGGAMLGAGLGYGKGYNWGAQLGYNMDVAGAYVAGVALQTAIIMNQLYYLSFAGGARYAKTAMGIVRLGFGGGSPEDSILLGLLNKGIEDSSSISLGMASPAEVYSQWLYALSTNSDVTVIVEDGPMIDLLKNHPGVKETIAYANYLNQDTTALLVWDPKHYSVISESSSSLLISHQWSPPRFSEWNLFNHTVGSYTTYLLVNKDDGSRTFMVYNKTDLASMFRRPDTREPTLFKNGVGPKVNYFFIWHEK